jgi:hypothetical protein
MQVGSETGSGSEKIIPDPQYCYKGKMTHKKK